MIGYLLILAPTAAMAYAAITAQTAAGTFIWSMLSMTGLSAALLWRMRR